MYSTTDAQYHSYKITFHFGIQKGIVNNKSFGMADNEADGYILTSNSNTVLPESDFSSASGSYNPVTREIYIEAVKKAGGSITIRGVKE